MVANGTAGWVTEKNTGPVREHTCCGRDREKLVEQLPIDEYVLVRDLSTHWAPLNISKWLGKLSCMPSLATSALPRVRCVASAWAIALSGPGQSSPESRISGIIPSHVSSVARAPDEECKQLTLLWMQY